MSVFSLFSIERSWIKLKCIPYNFAFVFGPLFLTNILLIILINIQKLVLKGLDNGV